MGSEPEGGRPRRRRRLYVHRIQRKYAAMMGLVLFFYTLLIVIVALAVPLLRTGLEAKSGTAYAAREFIVLSETLWPALIVGVVGAGFLSFFVTHRIAGPLFRLEKCAEELADGNLALRIHFRKDDELHALAESLNEALERIDSTVRTARDRGRELETQLDAALSKARSKAPADAIDQLEASLATARALNTAMAEVRVSEDGENPPRPSIELDPA